MLQFPAYMTQYPWSTTKTVIPTPFLLQSQWPLPQSDELLLAMEESDFEDKLNEVRKSCISIPIIGKSNVDNDKEDFDNEGGDDDDDDVDNAEESDVEEFEQETA